MSDNGIAKKQTSIKFYSWHADGTKTFLYEIPNKARRSKWIDSREDQSAPDVKSFTERKDYNE